MPMKTNTPPNSETQVRIQQSESSSSNRAWTGTPIISGWSGCATANRPSRPQRFSPANFLPFAHKQLTLADKVFVVYEAGPGGFTSTASSPRWASWPNVCATCAACRKANLS